MKTVGSQSQGASPDPVCTPCAVDLRVNLDDVGSAICTRGWTATVRPPVNVTERIKIEQMAACGLAGQPNLAPKRSTVTSRSSLAVLLGEPVV
jgi:hypothetical protein